ncbi:MAG: TetR/AcrR family transcriptional regulator [Acidimicrobiales bacterium]|nr:TetR/AcrR family transcriptional regulator [Acidimicrobiales bacterium]
MSVDGRGAARRDRAVGERAVSKDTILDATRALLRKGSALEIRAIDIAEESGLSRQTVFQYYPVIRLIFFELSDLCQTALQEAIGAVDPTEADWEIRIPEVAAAILLEDSAVYRQVLFISASQGRGADAVMAGTRDVVKNMFASVRAAADGGGKYPSFEDDLAEATLTQFQGLMYQWAAGLLTDAEFKEKTTRAAETVVRHGLNHLNAGGEAE